MVREVDAGLPEAKINDLPFELDVPKYIYTKPPTYNTSPIESFVIDCEYDFKFNRLTDYSKKIAVHITINSGKDICDKFT